MNLTDIKFVEKADVYKNKIKSGKLRRSSSGSIFTYTQEATREGIAFHLPFSQKQIETTGANLHPFFAGLIPEGLRLRSLVKAIKTSEDDLMSLLLSVCWWNASTE